MVDVFVETFVRPFPLSVFFVLPVFLGLVLVLAAQVLPVRRRRRRRRRQQRWHLVIAARVVRSVL